jgi:hypothetical protein
MNYFLILRKVGCQHNHMKLLKILGLFGAGVSALTTTLPVMAIPYNTSTVYKASDATGDVIIFSSAPGSRLQVSLGNLPRATARIAGSCGEVRISVPSTGDFTGLKVDGVAVDASALPVQTLPSCVSGSFAEARASNFKLPNGPVIIVGKTPGAAVAIEIPQPTTRSVTINGCGFGTLRARTGETLPATFSLGTDNYTFASLSDATNVPICRTSNGISTGYVPASWLP